MAVDKLVLNLVKATVKVVATMASNGMERRIPAGGKIKLGKKDNWRNWRKEVETEK